ncbi:LEAF RUST 10 DISEASE-RESISTANCEUS RECEPTOR-LIKE PROTEIN KINASE-like 2.4 [Nicotiana sylvestris]|uniref:Probable receptor-like protein kinase At1g67000 n=1 Tax=Nicotiana sylvestris TaxID=4096 RepID=A0A1U7XGV2_NICSY|nr:PREDICTED: probable receptor-like protein kinase At1g67000 [Nicotiana sylvestris]XP_016478953.1 PREDICTED: LEAF RUST 10 DISEASE-RESISTANCE LOCUS RECEPTOR-LIKE PROTEIN KINASE-like 2.5 isoform X1 [Nicotiana tabacum]
MSGGTKFLSVLTILIFLQLSDTPFAKQNQRCAPSSCGHIKNISYPFRLKTDPKHCGDEKYELSCKGNRTILTIFTFLDSLNATYSWNAVDSLNYYVQAINYDNSTIRLVDPGIREQVVCSLPQHSITDYTFFTPSFQYDFFKSDGSDAPLAVKIAIFSCPFAMNSPAFVEITNCLNRSDASNVSSKGHTYAATGNLYSSDLGVGCSVNLMSLTSWPTIDDANVSILELHNALAYGFELSWFGDIYCNKCRNIYDCVGENSRNVRCLEINCKDYNFRFFKVHTCENSRDVRCEDYTCKVYNFEFFKTLCGHKRHVLSVLISVLAGIIPWILGDIVVAKIILFPCIFVFLMIELRRRHLSIFDAIESFLHSEHNFMPIQYPYSNIRKMTRNFKEKVGQGGYGSVYKGKLRSGPDVAVKILTKPKADGQDFINEVATIGRIHHVNVVQLIGYCAERSKRALVYDFMPNGSLDKYITPREGGTLLSWQRKSEIALGVARGIEYLHRGCDIQILHFDIKPHNILLDENFVPKISDFGLAKLYPTDNSIVTLTAARGTIGYVAPELINRSIGPISYKADVYSFGMLLIEIAGMKGNSAAREDMSSQYFPHWIYDQFDKEKEIEVLDETHDDEMIIKKLTLVALWCIQMNPLDRPSMTKVVEMLEGELQALQTPPRPFESLQPSPLEFNLSSSLGSTESMILVENCSDSAKVDVIIG